MIRAIPDRKLAPSWVAFPEKRTGRGRSFQSFKLAYHQEDDVGRSRPGALLLIEPVGFPRERFRRVACPAAFFRILRPTRRSSHSPSTPARRRCNRPRRPNGITLALFPNLGARIGRRDYFYAALVIRNYSDWIDGCSCLRSRKRRSSLRGS